MGVRGNNSPECATALPPQACGLLRLFSGLSLRNMSEPPPLPPESAVKSLTRKSNWAKPDLARGSTCRHISRRAVQISKARALWRFRVNAVSGLWRGSVAETPRNAGVSQRYEPPLYKAAMSRLNRRCLSLALVREARRDDAWRLTAVVAGSQRRWRCTGQRHRCGAMKPQPGPASARASALAVGRRTRAPTERVMTARHWGGGRSAAAV